MVNLFEEDIEFLESWANSIRKNLLALKQREDNQNRSIYFSISTTTKKANNKPYLTPIRNVEFGLLFGVVVYSQIQALIACQIVDGEVDIVLVDAEKKIDIQFKNDGSVSNYFGINILNESNFANIGIELGNLSAACKKYIKKSKVLEYKPNDLTVEAVWHIITQKIHLLSGKKIAIIGCGNIGFKLALKLVEAGVNVEFVRRDIQRGLLMANLINEIKPPTTLAKAYFQKDVYKAALFADVIIGTSSGNSIIDWNAVQVMRKGGFLVDVGKGTFTEEAIANSLKDNIVIYRCDVSCAIYGYLSAAKEAERIFESSMGRAKYANGVYLVSGGILGLYGDIVVDDYRKPSSIIGIANGKGDFVRKYSKEQIKTIELLEKEISNKVRVSE